MRAHRRPASRVRRTGSDPHRHGAVGDRAQRAGLCRRRKGRPSAGGGAGPPLHRAHPRPRPRHRRSRSHPGRTLPIGHRYGPRHHRRAPADGPLRHRDVGGGHDRHARQGAAGFSLARCHRRPGADRRRPRFALRRPGRRHPRREPRSRREPRRVGRAGGGGASPQPRARGDQSWRGGAAFRAGAPGRGTAPGRRDAGTAGRRPHARVGGGQRPAPRRGRGARAHRKPICANPRKWRRWGSSPAASRTISTTS